MEIPNEIGNGMNIIIIKNIVKREAFIAQIRHIAKDVPSIIATEYRRDLSSQP